MLSGLPTPRRHGLRIVGLLRATASRPSSFLERKREDYRIFTIAMLCTMGLMGLALWIWDYVVDPVGARSTVVHRFSFLLVGLVPALIFAKVRNRLVLQATTVTALMSSVFLFSTITNHLKSGHVYGIGAYLFLVIAVILFCQGFSAEFGIVCAILGGLLPQALGVVGYIPDFQHAHYAVLIWPAVGLTCVAMLAMSYNYGALFDAQSQLELVSVVDPLTEAGNRRLLMPVLEQELARSKRFGHPLSLLVIDIDDFKQINDRLGHQVGDAVLRQLADTCRAAIRKSDTLARLGGDEFAVLLPETDAAGALGLAETIRAAAESSPPLGPDGRVVRYTVSVGVAQALASDLMETALIGRADAALYEAKQAGRNLVRG